MKTSCSLPYRLLLAALTALLSIGTSGLHAQPGSQDLTFNATRITGEVGFSVAVQPDGKVIAAGTFGVMRFLPDGSVDAAFQSIPPGPASVTSPGAVALQPDGRILVTGNFTNAAGASLPGVLRLNTDGSIDPSFSLDSRVIPTGRVLALQSDGKVLADGQRLMNDEAIGTLIRLRSDGSLDPDWDALWYNNSAQIYDLAVAPDGKVYFVSTGIFRTHPDGSRDESFDPAPSLPPRSTIKLQFDGKLMLGQYSDGPSGDPVRRLLPDGAEDPGWSGPDVDGGDAEVHAILVQPDGKVLVGGNNLQGFNGVYNANLGRLNPDGSVDTTFDTRGDLHYYSVEDMALAPDGKVIVAGTQVYRSDYSPGPGIWRLNSDTGVQPKLGISFTQKQGIVLELHGQPGATYRLEFRELLSGTGAWTKLTELTLSGGASATWQDPQGPNPGMRFYRAVSLQ